MAMAAASFSSSSSSTLLLPPKRCLWRFPSASHDQLPPASALPATKSHPSASPPSNFTDMHKPGTHLTFWTTHEGITPIVQYPSKGWLDEQGVENRMLLAKLLLIANMAKDRAEMHSIIGQQRDNWNKLFQSTLTVCSMTAAVLSALDGQHKSMSMSLPACAIDVAVVAFMSWINRVQPSQLAEEQRGASRMFRRLAHDIEYTLQVSPDLRQEAGAYLEECRNRLFALDKSFPLPLTPNGLEKFPEKVDCPILSQQPDATAPEIKVSSPENGWSDEISEDLINIAQLLKTSDIKIYKDWAQEKLRTNRFLAIGAPLLASCGAGLNLVDAFGSTNLGLFAALSSVLAAFTAAVSHDMQVGMVFELYRNCAGYFADMDATIQRTVRVPVKERENGLLFHQRIAYQLGRTGEQLPAVPKGSKTAGILF